MPRLDLDADNVKEETLTVAEIRAMDIVLTEKMKHKEFYLVIKVTA